MIYERAALAMVDLDQDSSIEDAVPNEAFIRALLIVDQDNPITREDVEQLASAILRTTNICSRENVKVGRVTASSLFI